MSCTTSARPIYQPIDHQHIQMLHYKKLLYQWRPDLPIWLPLSRFLHWLTITYLMSRIWSILISLKHKQSIDKFFFPKDDMIGKIDSKPVLMHVIKTYHLTFNIVQLAITDKQPFSRTQYPYNLRYLTCIDVLLAPPLTCCISTIAGPSKQSSTMK